MSGPYAPIPPGQTPVGYAPAGTYMPPQRPNAVTVLSIIGIIFSCGMVICALASVSVFFIPQVANQPGMEFMRDPTVVTVSIVSTVATILLSLVRLVGCIGSLKLMGWAWGAMMAYAAIALVLTPIELAIQIFVVAPAQQQSMADAGIATSQAQQVGGIVGTIFGTLIAIAYPVCVLIFYSSKRVKDAFRSSRQVQG